MKTKDQTYETFTVNYARLHQSYIFDIPSTCRCNTDCLCLIYQHSVHVENPLKSFPTTHRLVRREIKDTPDYKALLARAKKKGVTLGEAISNDKAKFNLLKLLWVYQDVEAITLKDIPPTDLITHRIQLKEGTKIHQAKYQKLSQDREWWLRRMIEEVMDAKMYGRTVTANGRPSKWNANPVLMHKPGQVQPHLTFNYHFIYKDIPASHIEAANNVHNLLSIASNQCLFSADIKHGYWVVNVHSDDRHYLAFHVPGIGQIQPTRMPQGARTSIFTFNELMNIVLGPIPAPQPEPLLLYGKSTQDPASLTFYMDDIFRAFKTYHEQYIFLRDHFFPRMVWSRLKLMLSKVKIGMTKIFALGEEHEIGRRVRLKPNKIEKILIWPVPQDQTAVRAFLGTIQSTCRWILGFIELARSLIRLTEKVKWRWIKSEELAFQILRQVCTTKAAMFRWDPALPVDLYSDASNFAAGYYITQIQDGETRPLVYDSITLLSAERNYDTYRRELVAIVKFTKKYSHMLNAKRQSVVHTDHKLLVGFLNAKYHEDIFAR